MPQMSSRQAIHIVLLLPLHSTSRKTVFINIAPEYKQMRKPRLLQQEHPDSKDIVCISIRQNYIALPTNLEATCLEKYASSYSSTDTTSKRKKNLMSYVTYGITKKGTQIFFLGKK